MIHYILELTICSGLLWGFYKVVLEREKTLVFNRSYLLFSIVFSLVIPLVELNWEEETRDYTLIDQAFNIKAESSEVLSLAYEQDAFTLANWFSLIYFTVASALLFSFILKLSKLAVRIKQADKVEVAGKSIVLDEQVETPFSFLNWVFVNKHKYLDDQVEEELYTHELTHVSQLHSIDILFVELVRVVCWFNPFFHLMKKSIQLNHEFLADEHVVHQHQNIAQYQSLLLQKVTANSEVYLASSLNFLMTKKRLVMMTKNNSKKRLWISTSATIPFVCSLFLFFSGNISAQSVKEKVIETETVTEFFTEKKIVFVDENGKKTVKVFSELTEEEKAKLPPPPPVFIDGEEVETRTFTKEETVEVHEDGKRVKVKMKRIPPVPPAPPAPDEHLKELIEEGAVFHLNKKEISAEEMKKLLETEQSLNKKHAKLKIKVKEKNNEKPQVFIETK